MEAQAAVEVAEKDAAHVVAFGDDDGVLVAEGPEVGEGGTEHGVGRYVAHAGLFVKLLEAGLHGGDVAEDAVGGEVGNDAAEHVEGVFERDGVHYQFGAEAVDFLERGEAQGVVHEAQALRVDVVDGCLVVETEQVDEEGAHLARAKDEYSHGVWGL